MTAGVLSAIHELTASLAQIPAGERRWLGNLAGALPSLVLTELVKTTSHVVVMVAKDSAQVSLIDEELRFFGITPHVFPDWETLPYDRMSVHQSIISERLSLLSNIPKQGIILVAATTLAQRIAPPKWLLGQHFDIAKGQKLNFESQRQRLSRAGYRAVETVFEPGEYALRGSLMDIFPMGQAQPIRIELFDDEVESLRLFDPETQRTTTHVEHFRLLPAQEFPLIDGRGLFRERFGDLFTDASPKRTPFYEDVLNWVSAKGLR